ncbi:MAG: glycosyltransferase, partial [Polyangiales bacterium]
AIFSGSKNDEKSSRLWNEIDKIATQCNRSINQIANTSDKKYIIFGEGLSEAALTEMRAGSDICTMPSSREPFGLVGAECMGIGLPTILHNGQVDGEYTVGLTEYLTSEGLVATHMNDSGAAVALGVDTRSSQAYGDAMLQLLEYHKGNTATMAVRGAQHVHNHMSWTAVMHQIVKGAATVGRW